MSSHRQYRATIPEKSAELAAHAIVAMVRWFMHAGLPGKLIGMAAAMFVTNLSLAAVNMAPAERVPILLLIGILCVFATLLSGIFGIGRR